MKKLLVIDGNSILNRAFFGIRPLSTKDGLPTNAVYGFTNILWGKIDEYKPDYCAVAFDLKAPTFRHKYYDLYKSNRHGMPDELAVQLPYAKKICEAMGMKVLSLEGYEADDILGTLSKKANDNGDFAYVLTGDRDSLQLICDKTNILLATNKDTLTFDNSAFFEKYGVTPDTFVDVKALMGDSSDCIPGVAGIGEKTALKLIAEYHDLDNLYEKFEGSSLSAGVKTKLRDGRSSAYMSRFLAKIECEVPLDISLEDIVYNGFNNEEFSSLLTRLEFSAMLKKLDYTPEADLLCAECVEVADILTVSGAEKLSVSYDDEKLYLCDGERIYSCEKTKENFEKLLNSNSELITFDSKDFRHNAQKFGVDSEKEIFDVMLYAYILNASDRIYKCEDVVLSYLGRTVNDKPGEALALFSLEKELTEKSDGDEKKLYYEIELPLSRVLCDMEEKGFKVDCDGLKKYSELLSLKEEELKKAIFAYSLGEFNLNSPKQLGEVLFEKLGLPARKKTKSGYSTGAEILEELREYHPIIDLILEYRKVAKLNSTYAIGLLGVADENGFVHTTFNQTVTATGRLSSTEPNLQNIPVKTELGRELRKYFIADSTDRVLIDADYSQIELRLLAEISGDETMSEAFESGVDIHTLTASQVFRVFPEAVTPELRKRAKAVNFGIVYGIGDFSLAKDIGTTKKKAGEYIRNYLDTYPKIDLYLHNIIEKAKEDGYVTTKLGRKRYIPELNSAKKMLQRFGERVAMNSPIQGTAADIIKIAMINVAARLKEEKLDAKLILQVHDELIVEASQKDAERSKEILINEMENAYPTKVRLSVEANMGYSWYEAK